MGFVAPVVTICLRQALQCYNLQLMVDGCVLVAEGDAIRIEVKCDQHRICCRRRYDNMGHKRRRAKGMSCVVS